MLLEAGEETFALGEGSGMVGGEDGAGGRGAGF
jgi:hypothetical protein